MTVGEMRLEVALRDISCLAPRLDQDAGPCRDRWGNEMSQAHIFLAFDDGEMDFVRRGAIGKRHELACDHCWLCPFHHQGSTGGYVWALAHREEMAEYLQPFRAKVVWDALEAEPGFSERLAAAIERETKLATRKREMQEDVGT